jgi:hypothetical protein
MAGRPRKVQEGEGASVPSASADVSDTAGASVPAYHREHPDKLTGQALRDLGHRKGMAKSELASMSDEKIRLQIRYIDYRRASEDAMV